MNWTAVQFMYVFGHELFRFRWSLRRCSAHNKARTSVPWRHKLRSRLNCFGNQYHVIGISSHVRRVVMSRYKCLAALNLETGTTPLTQVEPSQDGQHAYSSCRSKLVTTAQANAAESSPSCRYRRCSKVAGRLLLNSLTSSAGTTSTIDRNPELAS